MNAMAQLHADTKDHRDQLDALRWEIAHAADLMKIMASTMEVGGLRDLYFQWAKQTLEAAENI